LSDDEDIDHYFNNQQSTNDESIIGGLNSRIASLQHGSATQQYFIIHI
jgi:hypothetical protein